MRENPDFPAVAVGLPKLKADSVEVRVQSHSGVWIDEMAHYLVRCLVTRYLWTVRQLLSLSTLSGQYNVTCSVVLMHRHQHYVVALLSSFSITYVF